MPVDRSRYPKICRRDRGMARLKKRISCYIISLTAIRNTDSVLVETETQLNEHGREHSELCSCELILRHLALKICGIDAYGGGLSTKQTSDSTASWCRSPLCCPSRYIRTYLSISLTLGWYIKLALTITAGTTFSTVALETAVRPRKCSKWCDYDAGTTELTWKNYVSPATVGFSKAW